MLLAHLLSFEMRNKQCKETKDRQIKETVQFFFLGMQKKSDVRSVIKCSRFALERLKEKVCTCKLFYY